MIGNISSLTTDVLTKICLIKLSKFCSEMRYWLRKLWKSNCYQRRHNLFTVIILQTFEKRFQKPLVFVDNMIFGQINKWVDFRYLFSERNTMWVLSRNLIVNPGKLPTSLVECFRNTTNYVLKQPLQIEFSETS